MKAVKGMIEARHSEGLQTLLKASWAQSATPFNHLQQAEYG